MCEEFKCYMFYFISASRRSSSHLEVTRTELEKDRSVLHGFIGYSRSRFICRLGHLRSTNTINTSRTSSNIRRNICNNAHPSLRSLLQTLQERRHIVVVVDGELHVLSHNPNGHILEETSSRSHDVTVVTSASTATRWNIKPLWSDPARQEESPAARADRAAPGRSGYLKTRAR